MRAEFSLIEAGFAKLPTFSGNGGKAVIINAGATALSVTTGTLTLAGNFATSGANPLTLTTTASTNVTLPTTGTLSTLAGSEELDNKTLDSSVGKGTWTASGTWTLPALTLGGALTYGGVTLSNAVTGTGNMVLSASPTLTGTALAAALTLSSTLTLSGTAANIATGSNYISNGGTDAGLSFDASNNATLSAAATVGGQLTAGAGTVKLFSYSAATASGIANTTSANSEFILLDSTAHSVALGVSNSTEFTVAAAGASRSVGGIRIGADSTNNLLDDASTGAGTATLYIGNASINVTSDERVKTNVREWDGDAASILKALPVKAWDSYTQDDPQGGYTGGYVGFTAQDLHKAAPWAVNTQGDTGLPWQARYEFLNGIIVKGWQSHDSQIQSLTARLSKAESALISNGITIH